MIIHICGGGGGGGGLGGGMFACFCFFVLFCFYLLSARLPLTDPNSLLTLLDSSDRSAGRLAALRVCLN